MDIEVGEVVSTREGNSWDIAPPEETLDDLGRAYWWSEESAPGDSAQGTTFLYMHSCSKVRCAGDKLPRLAVGDLVDVTTPNGVLTYRVFKGPKSFPKEGSGSTGASTEVYDYDQPGWLTIITCGYTGDTSDINWVVWAELTS